MMNTEKTFPLFHTLILLAGLTPSCVLAQSASTKPEPRPGQDILTQRLSYARGVLQEFAKNPNLTLHRDTFPEVQAILLNQPPTLSHQNSQSVSLQKDQGTHPEATQARQEWQVVGTDALKPGNDTRFFRASSFSISALDQVNNVFTGDLDPVTGEPIFVDNPDSILWKVDYSVSPGKLFLAPSELKEIYETAAGDATKSLIAYAGLREDLDSKANRLAFLAWSDTAGNGKRFLSAISGSIGVAERSSLNGSERVPDFVKRGQDTDVTYSITFDPKRLILFPDETVDAYRALKAFTKLGGSSGLSDSDSSTCGSKDARECLKQLADLGVHRRWIAGAIPKVKIQTVDQFDFVAVGGDFLQSNLLEDSIETYTLTWDLGGVLETAKHRRKALEAIALHDELVNQDRLRNCTLQIQPPTLSLRVAEGQVVYQRFEASYREGKEMCHGKKSKVKWSLEPGLGLSMLSDGALVGTLPKGEHRALVKAENGVKTVATSSVTIMVDDVRVRQARQQLVGSYAEISLFPEVVLDDSWFESFQQAWHVVLSEADQLGQFAQAR